MHSVTDFTSALLLTICCQFLCSCFNTRVVVSADQPLDIRFAVLREQIYDLTAKVVSIKATFDEFQAKTARACPSDFTYVTSVNGCYKLLSQSLAWSSAAQQCRSLYRDAHLLVIDNAAEQLEVENFIRQSGTAQCGRDSWGIGLWTAGQRVNPLQHTPFVWKMSLGDGQKFRTSYMSYSNWLRGEPDFDNYESCLNIVTQRQFQWNDSQCSKLFCSICEIDVTG